MVVPDFNAFRQMAEEADVVPSREGPWFFDTI